jgi:hypothetical protein
MESCPGFENQGILNMRAADPESQKNLLQLLTLSSPPIPNSAVELCHLQTSKAFGKIQPSKTWETLTVNSVSVFISPHLSLLIQSFCLAVEWEYFRVLSYEPPPGIGVASPSFWIHASSPTQTCIHLPLAMTLASPSEGPNSNDCNCYPLKASCKLCPLTF